MSASVYKYGRGGKYAYMFNYAYAGIKERNIQMSRDDTNMNRVMRTSTGTVTLMSIKFVEKEERIQKDGYKQRTGHKTYLWIWQ